MAISPFSVLAAALSLTAITGWHVQAEEPAKPADRFDVEKLTLNPEELAKDLGYTFNGATWHFTKPTYVRVKVWNVETNSTKSTKEPQDSLPPSDTLTLRGPLKETSLRLLTREVDVDNDLRHDATPYTQLGFVVQLSGKAATKETPEGEASAGKTTAAVSKLQQVFAGLLGQKLSDEATFTEGTGSRYSSRIYHYNSGGGSGAVIWNSGNAGGFASQLEQLQAIVGQPDEEAKVRELANQWLATVEKNLLACPLKVYSYTKDHYSDEKHQDVKSGIAFVLMLECSRQPFPPDPPKHAATEPPTPSPTATPVPMATP